MLVVDATQFVALFATAVVFYCGYRAHTALSGFDKLVHRANASISVFRGVVAAATDVVNMGVTAANLTMAVDARPAAIGILTAMSSVMRKANDLIDEDIARRAAESRATTSR